MVQIAAKFQNCSEISAQECVYHLLSMPVCMSTREHAFINTFGHEERYAILKSKRYLESMKEDATSVFMTSIHEKYVARPNELADICLAEFVAGYNYFTKAEIQRKDRRHRLPDLADDQDDLDDDVFEQLDESIELEPVDNDPGQRAQSSTRRSSRQRFELKGNLGFVEKRDRLKIIRYRRYNKQRQEWDFYREQVMLFMPWTNELEQVEVEDTFAVYERNKTIISENRLKFEGLLRNETEAEAVERMERELDEQRDVILARQVAKQIRIDDLLMGRADESRSDNGEEQAIDDEQNLEGVVDELEQQRIWLEEELEEATGYHADNEDVDNARTRIDTFAQSEMQEKSRRRMQDDAYRKFMCTLNRGQHTFMINCLNKIKRGERFNHLVVGESGTGKSALIKAIDQSVDRYLRIVDGNSEPEKPRVLLCAFTGMASFNIGGTTMHSAFSLPVRSGDMQELSTQRVSEMRKTFSKLRLVIIDEISLVGATLFGWVHRRLKQILGQDEPFGGVSMLLLGDFNQLQPVQDTWIFNERPVDDNNRYASLLSTHDNVNPLWSQFSIFRLTQIMRQAGDRTFAECLSCLGKYGLLGLSDTQLGMLNSRIVSAESIPAESVYLYFRNEDRIDRSKQVLKSKPGEEFINVAKYVVKGATGARDIEKASSFAKYNAKDVSAELFSQLQHKVLLKTGVRYMLTHNIDLADGLCNGTNGILCQVKKYLDSDDGKFHVNRVWIEWSGSVEQNVGAAMRNKNELLYRQDASVARQWTPLETIMASYRKHCTYKWSIERHQLPIDIAEAITIDKSQGQTLPCVAFDLRQKNLKRAHYYVALSRVRCLNDLYLFGSTSIVSGKNWQYKNEERRRAMAEKIVEEKDASYKEMRRMEEKAPFASMFPFAEETYRERSKQEDGLRLAVCVHNVAGLTPLKLECIKADYAMMNADVLVLLETHVRTCDKSIKHLDNYPPAKKDYYAEYQQLPGFHLVSMGSSKEKGARNGCAVYVREARLKQCLFLGDNSKYADGVYKGNDICELGMLAFSMPKSKKAVRLVYCYNHPGSSLEKCYKEVKHFIAQYTDIDDIKKPSSPEYMLIGDINWDLHKLEKKDANSNARQLFGKFLVIMVRYLNNKILKFTFDFF